MRCCLLLLLLLLSCTISTHILKPAAADATNTEPTPPPDEPETDPPPAYDPGSLSSVLAYATADNASYIDDLYSLVAIPSISALPEHSGDVLAAAGWLKMRLVSAGLDNVQVLHTEGPQPVVSLLKRGQVDLGAEGRFAGAA